MRVLLACECSGVVRDAFIRGGHDAVSCDLLPTERPGPHIQGDVLNYLAEGWDMMIAFPPCTYLSVSGQHRNGKPGQRTLKDVEDGVTFFMRFTSTKVPRVVIENPVSIMSTRWRKPNQIIQPWQYGDDASKTTCLWMLGDAKFLFPTKFVAPRMVCQSCGFTNAWLWGRRKNAGSFREKCPNCTWGSMLPRWANQTDSGQNKLPPSAGRAAKRAETYPGIADAMAAQWGAL